ncbi:MAG TPA: NAD(P)-dependent oxidoreductase [Candidatus Lokiarchaeia archaeon]|nr:NAD(P)-dependent oxidoreductase [Candidatus Lokiarchaeia archaeon]
MTDKKIGWIGTGVMGNSMCGHVITKGGFEAFVYNRTKEKADALVELGATWCDSAKDVAERSDVIFTIVGMPVDVNEVYFGEQGIFKGAKEGSIIVDMTTTEPALSIKIFEDAQKLDIATLDAPVSGGDVGAKNATLAIMVGGDEPTFQEILPIFQMMGDPEKIAYMGKAGAGQHTKMSNQIMIASTMVGVVESMMYAMKAGLDVGEMINIIGKGAAQNWSLVNYGPRILKGDFNPGFFIKHFLKDMGIALDEAKRMNLSLPGLALANQFYIAAKAMGLETLGTQGLYKVYEHMNGLDRKEE